mmetsp:Transcript_64311/g.192086  ORF Transcript_64311/g.192086 Transcript_64311/m.192086 type:complete len:234 (-) Transcript_64311:73-774(-)
MEVTRPVATNSSCGSNLLLKCLTIIFASLFCCPGVQCISSDNSTGSFEVVKAQSAIAEATELNFSTVQRVCPCVTIGSAFPSQQSISRLLVACRSWRRNTAAELRPVSWSPTMYELCEHADQKCCIGCARLSVALITSGFEAAAVAVTMSLHGSRSCRANWMTLRPVSPCSSSPMSNLLLSSNCCFASTISFSSSSNSRHEVLSSGTLSRTSCSCSQRTNWSHSARRIRPSTA